MKRVIRIAMLLLAPAAAACAPGYYDVGYSTDYPSSSYYTQPYYGYGYGGYGRAYPYARPNYYGRANPRYYGRGAYVAPPYRAPYVAPHRYWR